MAFSFSSSSSNVTTATSFVAVQKIKGASLVGAARVAAGDYQAMHVAHVRLFRAGISHARVKVHGQLGALIQHLRDGGTQVSVGRLRSLGKKSGAGQ